jgi:predicted signal transduction protein with EAL and GGDEF domain
LTVVGQRLRDTFAAGVVVARVGSDVFGILGPYGEVNAARIAAVFAQPFAVFSENLRLSATTGLVNLAGSPLKAVELLKNAGVALKQAKNYSRGKAIFFEAAHATEARERMQMLSRLRLAFSAERLFLVYQPFVDLASGRIVGAEALLRWRSEQGEFIPPDRFIPLAEQSGLMVPIGEWVTRSALRFLRRLTDLGQRQFRMAINVSHVQFREPNFVDLLIAAIKEVNVDPGNVEIELTESVAIDNVDLIDHKLSAIHAAGVAIAIDDFGTGYSSLNILRKLSVDRIKIDRAFVSGTDSLEEDYSIAEMILNLAAQLGLETIAEGIETQAQHDKLRSLGCRDGQGYYYSEPVTGDEFVKLLKSS